MKRPKRSHIFILAVVLSFALMHFSYLPVIGVLGHVLLLFSTLTHELGHGLTAMLVGWNFDTLTIDWDGSGLTTTWGYEGRITQGLVSAGGLIGPSIAACILFWSARGNDRRLNFTTRLFGAGLLLAGVLTARSFWAILFTVGLGALLLLLAGRISRFKMESLMVFIGVQLGLSVFTRADYLFTKWAGPDQPSDVAQMSQALFLPFWFWGIVCGLFSVVALYWGCRCYIEE